MLDAHDQTLVQKALLVFVISGEKVVKQTAVTSVLGRGQSARIMLLAEREGFLVKKEEPFGGKEYPIRTLHVTQKGLNWYESFNLQIAKPRDRYPEYDFKVPKMPEPTRPGCLDFLKVKSVGNPT